MKEQFSADERVILEPYVSNLDRSVFLLRGLPEEVVAVLLAYYSRSQETLRRNLLKLIRDQDISLIEPSQREEPGRDLYKARERARQFHEKWVIGYGHASVAEHAILHMAVEEVSIITSKVIEDTRLASFTEKSTRYVIFDENHYYPVPELINSSLGEAFQKTMRHLFDTYSRWMKKFIEKIETMNPRRPEMSEPLYRRACRAKACDLLRYLLPGATYTNLGMTINARSLEHLLKKMFSHPLQEVKKIAGMMKEEAVKVLPALMKYAEHNEYIATTPQEVELLAGSFLKSLGPFPPVQEFPEPDQGNSVRLLSSPQDPERKLAAAILYEYTHCPFNEITSKVSTLSESERRQIIDEYLRKRGQWDQPLRALEHLSYTFELVIDFGAYRDIQRHRMATQTAQKIGTAYGYSTPPEIKEFGYLSEYEECMEKAADLYEKARRNFPHEAPYVLPLAFRRQVLITWNLRELFHFIELRSSKEGHFSYRHIAQKIYQDLYRVHPFITKYIRVDLNDYEMARL